MARVGDRQISSQKDHRIGSQSGGNRCRLLRQPVPADPEPAPEQPSGRSDSVARPGGGRGKRRTGRRPDLPHPEQVVEAGDHGPEGIAFRLGAPTEFNHRGARGRRPVQRPGRAVCCCPGSAAPGDGDWGVGGPAVVQPLDQRAQQMGQSRTACQREAIDQDLQMEAQREALGCIDRLTTLEHRNGRNRVIPIAAPVS